MPNKDLVCCICGLKILEKERRNKEHEPPLSRGGERNRWFWAHLICNEIKGNLTQQEFAQVADDKYKHALEHWRIKPCDRRVIVRILKTKNK